MPRTIEWRPTLFSVDDGAFSSARRYVRKSTATGYALVSGQTVNGIIVGHNSASTNDNFVAYFMSIPGYVTWNRTDAGGGAAASEPAPTVQNVAI